MAGHSQFKNIMHRKGKQDAVRAKVFSKLAREITISAKLGLPDPTMNARLRAAILAARAENMPRENIERAIQKAATDASAAADEIRYEGYGPGGVAVIVEVITDNRNRTAADVRSYFTKSGGSLVEPGAVSYLFDRVGFVAFGLEGVSAEALFEAAIEAGAQDVASEAEHEVYCAQQDLNAVSQALESRFGEPRASRLLWRPQIMTDVSEEVGLKLLDMMEKLENHDDVQHVYVNANLPESLADKI